MSKYTEQFKHMVVQEYLSGHGGDGYRALSRRHGMANRSLIERWVAAYQLHGDAGLSKKRSRYDAAFKLSVLQHMWENRLSITQTAAKFDIRRHSTVGDWERAYREGGVEALTPPPTRRVKKIVIPTTKPETPAGEDKRSREELLAENEQLRMEVAYLKKLEALVQARQKSAAPKKRK
jgi:transposase